MATAGIFSTYPNPAISHWTAFGDQVRFFMDKLLIRVALRI